MISVIASIYVKDGQLDKFIEIFKSNMPAVLMYIKVLKEV